MSDTDINGEDLILNPDVAPERDVYDEASKKILELILEKPLYTSIDGDELFIEAVDDILSGRAGIEFDQYCITCGQVTPWTIKPYRHNNTGGGAGTASSSRYPQASTPKIRVVNAVCLRRQHFYTYVLHRNDLTAQKVGQKPSMADIAHGELKSIPGINSRDRKELGRALGLFAHDTPLGAFVYLRRVFERMIERAHEHHKERHGDYLPGWIDMRMGERIGKLAAELPPTVSTNYAVWGLLSKGIHELSDEDAQTLFPLIKAVIFEMLGEEERHRQAEQQQQETQKALQQAVAKFNPAKSPSDGK